MSRIKFQLATSDDDPELRCMLRENPIPGRISVSFEREPDYFLGAKIEGPIHQTIVARDQSSGEIVAMGTRSVRDVFLNGKIQRVGYLSQARITPGYRAMRRTLGQAFEFVRDLHEDSRQLLHFTSIIEDNLPARRFFSAGFNGMPHFQNYARMHTLAIYCRRRRRKLTMPDGIKFARGNSKYLHKIVACLQRNGVRHQLAPCWTDTTLFNPDHTPDLKPEDFYLALDRELVVGCLARWDQSRYKQAVVRGYSGGLARWRVLLNLGARLSGWPTFPPPDTILQYCYASHIAIDGDQKEIFYALLRELYNDTVEKKYKYFMLGFCEDHPFLEGVMRSYAHIDYRSQLYLVAWDYGLEAISQVDTRAPAPEIAVL